MFRHWRSVLAAAVVLAALARSAPAQTIVYDQPSNGAGFILSSWVEPEGSDADIYAYDNFTLAATTAITDIRWRGGYTLGALYGPVWDFTVTFFGSIANGSQPYCGNPQLPESPYYLAKYRVGGTAGETLVGSSGGLPMYEYHFTFPTPFVALAGTKYWVRIEASQTGYPDWGVARGAGPDNQHFQFSTGSAQFSFRTGDGAFALLTAAAPTFLITATASPAGAGTIAGAGPYPEGSLATLVASANPGFVFTGWTENGVTVSTSATYAFTVSADRTLVANFAPAYTIAISDLPTYGGSSAGGGVHAAGSAVTLTATPSPGFVFVDWTEFGSEVSATPVYSFTADMDRTLVAHYAPAGPSAWFDFDTGSPPLAVGEVIPFAQASNGVVMQVSSPDGGAFSLQSEGSTFLNLSRFSGQFVYPNSVNRSTLVLGFRQPLTAIYLTFATVENHQTEVPTPLRLSASLGAAPVGTTSAHATYGFDSFPMGTIGFQSAAPFDRVELVVPYQPVGATTFLVDDVLVELAGLAAVSNAPGRAARLLPPAPNPARGGIAIAFELPAPARVELGVFDLGGRRVRTLMAEERAGGRHDARWDGRDAEGALVPAGAYYIRLGSAGVSLARTAVLIR